MVEETPLLETRALAKRFALPRSLADRLLGRPEAIVDAVSGVDLSIARGETFGVIGESGCGKSTLGRTILKLYEPTAGEIRFEGKLIGQLSEAEFRPLRRRMQIVFQDPYASLNPRRTVAEIVGLPLRIHDRLGPRESAERVAEFLPRVGLSTEHMQRYPHQFSGGQRQRIGIARALILKPDFVVCDEPVSALDVSIQAQIIELLQHLRAEFGLTYLFISHDLAVIARLSNRIGVMYLGEMVETGARDAVLRSPAHPYARALLASAPKIGVRQADKPERLAGDLPSPLAPPPGCRFHTRCPVAMAVCRSRAPALQEIAPGHRVACHLYGGAP